MLRMWKNIMDHYFTSVVITCFDESVSFWSNNYNCPGFMFVLREPWPVWHEYHTIHSSFGVFYLG